MSNLYNEALLYTRPIDGQYPRPWMTDLKNPVEADLFIVGRNQRNGYLVEDVGSHERHVDALLNRNGQTCRGLYEALGLGSPTRANIDRLSRRLKDRGAKVLETNVVCFSSPMSADLTRDQRKHGTAIFEWLLDRIAPRVIIVHGSGAAKELSKLDTSPAVVIEMPALAPPAYNKWHGESEVILDQVADQAINALRPN